MYFVLNYFLASLPQFSHNYLCFQSLLSFVPTMTVCLPLFSITYWLRSYFFYFFAIPGKSLWPEPSRLLSARLAPGACPRPYVHSMTTLIGYHRAPELSSGKCHRGECEESAFPVLELKSVPGRPAQRGGTVTRRDRLEVSQGMWPRGIEVGNGVSEAFQHPHVGVSDVAKHGEVVSVG